MTPHPTLPIQAPRLPESQAASSVNNVADARGRGAGVLVPASNPQSAAQPPLEPAVAGRFQGPISSQPIPIPNTPADSEPICAGAVESSPFPAARGSGAAGPFAEGETYGAPGVDTPSGSLGGLIEPDFSRPVNRAPLSSPVVDTPTTDADWQEAQARANLCEQYLALLREPGMSCVAASRILGKSVSNFSGADCLLARYQRGGVAALLPQRRGKAGRPTPWADLPAWFIPAARQFWLLSNLNYRGGSVPEAIRRTVSLPLLPFGWTNLTRQKFLRALGQTDVPVCPPELRERILARQGAGQPLVPERIARRIRASRAAVTLRRNARNYSLDWQNCPGTQMRTLDPATGERRWHRAGDVIEADDATINFPVVVPWEIRGDKCSERFGVRVSRFQWLVSIDRASRYIPAFSYTARPRSSYRGEDVLGLMHLVAAHHGVPREWLFERGVWKSRLVADAVERMGARLHTVYSPHTKPFIEGVFNTLWTKLSVHFPEAHVGRTQGEEREAGLLLTACKEGSRDPRRYFPALTVAVQAMLETIAEKNATPVHSEQYGRWVPEDRWEADLAAHPIRQLDPASAWIFSPCRRTWTVSGFQVGGKVGLFEDLSVPYDFTSPELRWFDGARVTCYFDPLAPACFATVVLAEPWQGHKSGEVICQARQLNDTAAYARLVMGWAEDPATVGLTERQRNAAAVRRELRAILPRGRRGAAISEEHDGIAKTTRIERQAQESSSHTEHQPARRGGGSAPDPDRTAAPARPTFVEDLDADACVRSTRPVPVEDLDSDLPVRLNLNPEIEYL